MRFNLTWQAVHDLINVNEKLKQYVKPYLMEPKYDKLKDPTKLNAIKSDEMMNDLVDSITELVEDQVMDWFFSSFSTDG